GFALACLRGTVCPPSARLGLSHWRASRSCFPGPALSKPDRGASLFRVYVGPQQSASNFYARKPSSFWSKSTGGVRMLDLIYLALGLSIFALMGLYASWAANA